jgi:hypothetical protein
MIATTVFLIAMACDSMFAQRIKTDGGNVQVVPKFKAVVIAAMPDLTINQFLFPPSTDKALRVQVENSGNAVAAPCILRLTVRKINGTPVGRSTEIKIPAIPAGKDKWFVIKVKDILPVNVALEDTTFRLNVDVGGVVAESSESNNEVWHNL